MATAKRARVKLLQLPHARGLPLPAYQTEAAAGLDLVAALPEGEPVVLEPRQRAMIPTGLVVELPSGFEGQVRPRSGLAAKHGITVLNSPGTIDADYRGEVQVILVNLGTAPVTIARGERIAQLVVAAIVQAVIVETRTVTRTARGTGGFGSTGGAGAGTRSLNPAKRPAKKRGGFAAKAAARPKKQPSRQR